MCRRPCNIGGQLVRAEVPYDLDSEFGGRFTNDGIHNLSCASKGYLSRSLVLYYVVEILQLKGLTGIGCLPCTLGISAM